MRLSVGIKYLAHSDASRASVEKSRPGGDTSGRGASPGARHGHCAPGAATAQGRSRKPRGVLSSGRSSAVMLTAVRWPPRRANSLHCAARRGAQVSRHGQRVLTRIGEHGLAQIGIRDHGARLPGVLSSGRSSLSAPATMAHPARLLAPADRRVGLLDHHAHVGRFRRAGLPAGLAFVELDLLARPQLVNAVDALADVDEQVSAAKI